MSTGINKSRFGINTKNSMGLQIGLVFLQTGAVRAWPGASYQPVSRSARSSTTCVYCVLHQASSRPLWRWLKLSAKRLLGSEFASRYRLQTRVGFEGALGRCKTTTPSFLWCDGSSDRSFVGWTH